MGNRNRSRTSGTLNVNWQTDVTFMRDGEIYTSRAVSLRPGDIVLRGRVVNQKPRDLATYEEA